MTGTAADITLQSLCKKIPTICLIKKKLKLPIRSVSQDQKAGSKEKEAASKITFAEA